MNPNKTKRVYAVAHKKPSGVLTEGISWLAVLILSRPLTQLLGWVKGPAGETATNYEHVHVHTHIN